VQEVHDLQMSSIYQPTSERQALYIHALWWQWGNQGCWETSAVCSQLVDVRYVAKGAGEAWAVIIGFCYVCYISA
jgi:hypothetical protein